MTPPPGMPSSLARLSRSSIARTWRAKLVAFQPPPSRGRRSQPSGAQGRILVRPPAQRRPLLLGDAQMRLQLARDRWRATGCRWQARCGRGRASMARSVKPRILRAFCSTTIADMPSLRMTLRSTASSSSTMMGARPSSRLVEQDDARVDDQRAADRQHLLLAARELAAEVAAPLLPAAGTCRTRARPSTRPAGRWRSGSPPP